MSLRIAAIADVHYAAGALEECGVRRTAIADTLLLRAVQRLNRYIKPDVTVLLGDLVDDGSHEGLEHLSHILAKLESPYIAIPGNHDGDIDQFYSVFPRPDDAIDINGVRILPFIDPDAPGYNATRSAADIARMDRARREHDGPIISLQHVPLYAPNSSESPYGYSNAAEVWSTFERNDFSLSISGHWHAGDDMVSRGAGKAVIVPGLCESPFAFVEIEIDGESVQTRRHELCLPRHLQLMDYHVHSSFAYCSENMDMTKAIALAKEFGLGGLSFNEHSGQLYFDKGTFWGAKFLDDGIEYACGRQDRMTAYLEQAREHCPPAYLGFEIDCDNSGRPVIAPDDFARAEVRVGAVHWLQEMMKPEPDFDAAADEMVGKLTAFTASGIQILAHPLRVFRKTPELVPPTLVPRIIELLRKNGVAAEINFHIQETAPEFLRSCVDAGVKIVFGSDSHNLYEVGEFYPHLELVRRCGLTESDLPEIMAHIQPPRLN